MKGYLVRFSLAVAASFVAAGLVTSSAVVAGQIVIVDEVRGGGRLTAPPGPVPRGGARALRRSWRRFVGLHIQRFSWSSTRETRSPHSPRALARSSIFWYSLP